MVLLDRVVQKTMTGMAMHAVSYDKPTASLMGVPVDGIISATFAIGSAVAGAGGVLYSWHTQSSTLTWESESVGGRLSQQSSVVSEMSAAPCSARTYWLLLRYLPQWCAVLNLQRLRGVYCAPYRVSSQTDRAHGSCYRSEGVDSKTPGPC